ncbi:LamG domain-containing protein [Actinacidiphila guanduensis]|uniref:Concanavalin A-like lectin/glucanases superfamily protein n=1 Tax=Actinacidiphila guanduensis TaxID=310781 RepID=A0A1G9ZJM5_9ACTN|nr:LamG domain-containing protein [Actinacidiphila guanduensis]SDN21530.1 Concanavalin A-like lectin/glucanases superfamily protein [Actinacidiphila guanduensis]
MPAKRYRKGLAALAAGVLLAVLPVTAASAQGTGNPDAAEPAVPTEQGLVVGIAPVCATDSTAPAVIRDATPDLTARVHVVSEGPRGAELRAHFDLQVRDPQGTWTEVQSVTNPATGYITDGTHTTETVPEALAEGTLYRLAASTWSYTSDGTRHLSSPSTASTTGWCYYRVDTIAPLPPKVTFGTPYTDCSANDCAAHGGPGVPGTVTFSPGDGDTDVVGYEYQLDSGPFVQVTGSPATVDITPQVYGSVLLHVRARDSVGYGGLTQSQFMVSPPATSVGLWHFADGQAGDTATPAADSATGAGDRHPAALSASGADRSAQGRRGDGDSALALDGSTGYAATSGQVVDPSASFAVSAWARPADLAQDRTLVSQSGSDGSGFALRYSAADRAWQFAYSWTQDGTRHTAFAEASAGPVGVWTQLAGSYDAAARTLTLFVNGLPQGSPVTLPAGAAAQAASGDLEFGRAAGDDGSYGGYWHGSLDEVQVWQRTLSASQELEDAQLIGADGQPGVAKVVDWNAAGASGTALADGSGYGHDLTLDGGARLDGTDLVLDGSDGAATTPGPVVDDTGSFTVTALVQPDMAALADKPDGWVGQVVGERSADGSAWGLWYQLAGHEDVPDPNGGDDLSYPLTNWVFGRVNADGTISGARSEVTVWTPDVQNTPVRVTGVFDAQAGTASVFFHGSPDSSVPFTAVRGSGDLAVGRGYVGGSWGSYLPGRVTSVSLWAGAMNASQVFELIGD